MNRVLLLLVGVPLTIVMIVLVGIVFLPYAIWWTFRDEVLHPKSNTS